MRESRRIPNPLHAPDKGSGERERSGKDGLPSAETIRRARLSWLQSGQDFKEARRRLKAGDWLDASYLVVQSAVNALSCVCCLHGQFQLPGTSAVQLAALCGEVEPQFMELASVCGELEQALLRGPYDRDRDHEEEKRQARRCLQNGETVRGIVKKYLKHHRKRYFAP